MHITYIQLFQTTKIQTFESNSQPTRKGGKNGRTLFQTTKIQTFESNSQQKGFCFYRRGVVSDYKDTNF